MVFNFLKQTLRQVWMFIFKLYASLLAGTGEAEQFI